MIGIEISINGQEPIIAASDNFVFANFSYGYSSSDQIAVCGTDSLHHLTWLRGKPKKGDKVLVRIVETDEVSPILTMKDIDRNEMKKWYEHYKAELQKKGLI